MSIDFKSWVGIIWEVEKTDNADLEVCDKLYFEIDDSDLQTIKISRVECGHQPCQRGSTWKGVSWKAGEGGDLVASATGIREGKILEIKSFQEAGKEKLRCDFKSGGATGASWIAVDGGDGFDETQKGGIGRAFCTAIDGSNGLNVREE